MWASTKKKKEMAVETWIFGKNHTIVFEIPDSSEG